MIRSLILLLLCLAAPVQAQDLRALARFDPGASGIYSSRSGITIRLALSQPVPFRVVTYQSPPRLVVGFSEVSFGDVTLEAISSSTRVTDLNFPLAEPGWSRIGFELDGPYGLAMAEMKRDADTGAAVLTLEMDRVTDEEFAGTAMPPGTAEMPMPAAPPLTRQTGDRPLVIALDPGHGGFDPGAERGDLREADLVLTFAHELKEKLILEAGHDVIMTRVDDRFVPLRKRLSRARMGGADLFISLHADAVEVGEAHGATVYTLSEKASDAASALLAERHDRTDLLAGADLTKTDDAIAEALMDIARVEVQPRSDRFARHLVAQLRKTTGHLHKRPHMGADFSVLRAPDIPAVLLELGFMSSSSDLERIIDPAFRAKLADAIVAAIDAWAVEDAVEATLIRQ